LQEVFAVEDLDGLVWVDGEVEVEGGSFIAFAVGHNSSAVVVDDEITGHKVDSIFEGLSLRKAKGQKPGATILQASRAVVTDAQDDFRVV